LNQIGSLIQLANGHICRTSDRVIRYMVLAVRTRSNLAIDFIDFLGLSNTFGITEPRLAHGLSIFSHHKCGTVWLRTFLAELCKLNGLSFDSNHEVTGCPSSETRLFLLTNAVYHNVKDRFEGSALHVIRNPMSIIVSAYHSHLTSHPTHGWPELAKRRKLLRSMSYEEGLEATVAFLEEFRSDEYVCPLRALQVWNYEDQRILTVPMESLTTSANTVMQLFLGLNGAKRFKLPDIKNYAFEKFSNGRLIGAVDNTSHYRSGDTLAWPDELPKSIQDHVRKNYSTILRNWDCVVVAKSALIHFSSLDHMANPNFRA
jgi:hypothetical protein